MSLPGVAASCAAASRRKAAAARTRPTLRAASLAASLAALLGAASSAWPAHAASDPVTGTIEQRPPARPLSEAVRVDVDRLAASDLDRLAQDSRNRWMQSSHGPLLMRILPERLQPSKLPDAGSRGARLTALYCVQCHNLPDPAMHDGERWERIVQRMVPRMQGRGNLGPLMSDLMRGPESRLHPLAAPTPAEEREIVGYLQQHAQRGLDPATEPSVAEALDRGAGRAFSQVCSQCHVLPDPKRHTAEEWPEVVQRMQRNLQWMNRVVAPGAKAHDTARTANEIVGFLQSHARR